MCTTEGADLGCAQAAQLCGAECTHLIGFESRHLVGGQAFNISLLHGIELVGGQCLDLGRAEL